MTRPQRRLYLLPLFNSSLGQDRDSAAAQIQQSGLIDRGNVATEKVATDAADMTVNGQLRLAEFLADKLADEFESMAESGYEALPLFDASSASTLDRKRGYYEVESAEVRPAHVTAPAAYEFTLGLTKRGSRETHWRAVKTAVETINHSGAGAGDPHIGVSNQATKAKWFDTAQGFEVASTVGTASAEFGTLDIYDPDDASFSNPTLLYELPYTDDDGSVDVRVYDDRDEDKMVTVQTGDGTESVNRWIHAFDPAFDFEGRPVLDNGLKRVRFDDGAGDLDVFSWGGSSWSDESITLSSHSLFDADITRIGPAEVRVYVEAQSGSTIDPFVLSLQRGIDGVILREHNGTTIDSSILSDFSSVMANHSEDPGPNQTLVSRTEVK